MYDSYYWTASQASQTWFRQLLLGKALALANCWVLFKRTKKHIPGSGEAHPCLMLKYAYVLPNHLSQVRLAHWVWNRERGEPQTAKGVENTILGNSEKANLLQQSFLL